MEEHASIGERTSAQQQATAPDCSQTAAAEAAREVVTVALARHASEDSATAIGVGAGSAKMIGRQTP